MKTQTLLMAVFLATSTVLGAGCAHYGADQTGREVVSDSTITTKVKSALLAEKDVNSLDISVETYDGTVQLSGFVDSQWQIDQAVKIATAVHGVKKVKSDLLRKTR
ncbi:MAG: BON domain-containing protein [Gammaproteobacteria bacterium]|nr:BON domain-containing protein [Gammaproteobacteria bacterium]